VTSAAANGRGKCVATERAPFHDGSLVKPRVHVLTLAVEELERSLTFYRQLGLESAGIVATEFVGDDENAAGAIAIFELERGFLLALYPRSELAKDAKIPQPAATSGMFSIGHAVGSRDEVDAMLDSAEAAGATVTVRAYDRAFGVYSGYFQDPDGHLWEVLWNPALEDV
jgi:predicted lactoylglutathione lyase